MRKALNYEEGTTFFVPLRTKGFARGVVARLDGKGIIFAYFFGPMVEIAERKPFELEPSDSCLIGRCGDLGLINGSWSIVGDLLNWNRSNWPLPTLCRRDEKARKAWLSFYDDLNLELVREEPIQFLEECLYPYDRLMGYGSVEIKLTKLLASSDGDHSN